MATKKVPNPTDSPRSLFLSRMVRRVVDLGYGDLLEAWLKDYSDDKVIAHKMLQLLLDLGEESLVKKWMKEVEITIKRQANGHDYGTKNVSPLVKEGGAE